MMTLANVVLYIEDEKNAWRYTTIALQNASKSKMKWTISWDSVLGSLGLYGAGRIPEVILPWKHVYSTPVRDRSTAAFDRERLIVFWTPLYRKPSIFEGRDRFADCPYKCVISNNKSLVGSSDAVVFHTWDLLGSRYFPRHRAPHQKYVLYGREPPPNVRVTSEYNHLFNVTHTYKLDADVYFAQGRFVNRSNPFMEMGKNYLQGKTKEVGWIVSNCKTHSLRDDYVAELGRYIPVDVYGDCGTMQCGAKYSLEGEGNCTLMLRKHYKFYLAFENSLCEDYITEKVWKALRYDVIPVVLGNANYEKFLPQHSYIDVRNFSSPSALAEFLKYVGNNSTLYNSYFKWKAKYEIVTIWNHFCDLCAHLYTHENVTQIYTDLGLWWNKCALPDVFYKGIAENISRNYTLRSS